MTPNVQIKLIYARTGNGVIGHHNTVPWHLPEDMAHFKRTTLNCPVIMGRKTWDSLPIKFRPLPGRLNIVMTRQFNWYADGAQVAHSLEDACHLCPPNSTAWVIGGAEIYAQALELACEVVVTEIDAAFEGDAFAPVLGADWLEVAREHHTAQNGLRFDFVTFTRHLTVLSSVRLSVKE